MCAIYLSNSLHRFEQNIYRFVLREILRKDFKYIVLQYEKKSVLSPLSANSKVTFIIFVRGILWVFLSKKFKKKKIKKK
jgi:hypothetical protein